MTTETGEDLARLAGVEERLIGLLLHERHERKPVRTGDHERVVRVANHAGEFGQHDLVQDRVHFGGVDDGGVLFGHSGHDIRPRSGL